jgi:site-specific recombinase XerD
METTIKLSPEEFDAGILDRIKYLIQEDDVDIFIVVRKKDTNTFDAYSEYLSQFEQSVKDKNENRTINFTAEEFSDYVKENFSS